MRPSRPDPHPSPSSVPVFDLRNKRHFLLPSTAELGYEPGVSLTVEVLLRAERWESGDPVRCGGDSGILCGAGPHAAGQCLICVVRNGRPLLDFFCHGTTGPCVLPTGKWLHILFQWNAAKHEQAIFVDGERVVSAVRRDRPALQATKKPLRLGIAHVGSGFCGEVALLRIWFHAFTDDEARALAHAPATLGGGSVPRYDCRFKLTPDMDIAKLPGVTAPAGIELVHVHLPSLAKEEDPAERP